MATQVIMPKPSPTMEKGQLSRWLKKEGDKVSVGEPLAEIDTGKATMEMQALGNGVLRKILIKEGESAPPGQLIAIIGEPDEDISRNGRSSVRAEAVLAMNLPQRIVLLLGAIAVAFNTLFAPWVVTFKPQTANWAGSERFAGYHLITSSNQPQDITRLDEMFGAGGLSAGDLLFFSTRLDLQRLMAQLVGILCVTVLCFFAVKGRKNLP